MAAVPAGSAAAVEFLKALGIPTRFVKRVVLDFKPGAAVTVYVQRYIEKAELELLAKTLSLTDAEKAEAVRLVECGPAEDLDRVVAGEPRELKVVAGVAAGVVM